MNPNRPVSRSSQQPAPGPIAGSVPVLGQAPGAAPVSTDLSYRESQIALTAYFLAEKRGFAQGGELDDWLAAEAREGKSTE